MSLLMVFGLLCPIGGAGKPSQKDTPQLWCGQQPDHLYHPKHQRCPQDYQQGWKARLHQWTWVTQKRKNTNQSSSSAPSHFNTRYNSRQSLCYLSLTCRFLWTEATNHDRSKEKPNGSLEETTAVEVATSPPRTTLLGTIFSPVFNFFSPAKNGEEPCFLFTEHNFYVTTATMMGCHASHITYAVMKCVFISIWSCPFISLLCFSLLWLWLSRPGTGSRGDSQAAGHGANCGDAHQHSHIHAGTVCPH